MDGDGNRFLSVSRRCRKNNQGGLKHRKIKRKVVDAYENEARPERCIVNLYEKYVSRRPVFGDMCSPFYLRPLEYRGGQHWDVTSIWFSKVPIGRQKLAHAVPSICRDGGLSGYRTNHSLRVSAATRMFEEGVDEQMIKSVTGHRSDAVREYKRPSNQMHKNISKIVQGSTDSGRLSNDGKTHDEQTKDVVINLNLNIKV